METEFGRYLLTERLGIGSLTEAYRAKSFGVEGFEKGIVVKRVLKSRADLPGLVDAFVAHAKASLTLSHANVVQVIDLGRTTAQIPGEGAREHTFIATELVDGVDVKILLQHVREKRVPLPVGLALFVAAEIAKALDHAHKRRTGAVLHGPLTPQSVFVSWEGEVKVSDFALHRALSAVRFEPDEERALPYLSPEEINGREIGPDSDIFSLGSLLYELLTTKIAFRGADRDATRILVCSAKPTAVSAVRPDVPSAIENLVEKMLASDRSRRFADAGVLHEEIVTLGYSLGVIPQRGELAELVSRLCRYAEASARNDDGIGVSLSEATPAPSTTAAAGKREATLLVLSGLGISVDRDDLIRKIERAGGVIVSSDAAEARAVFGIVEADGRDTEAAVLVALEVTHEMPNVGIGIDLGRVTADDRATVVSDIDLAESFATAARFASAGAGTVRLTKAASRVVEREVEIEADPEQADAWRAAKRRLEHLAVSRFVGRRLEIERVGAHFGRAQRGQHATVLVTGQRGVGKTRLIGELERRLAKLPSGAHLYRATCPRDLTGSPTTLGAIAALTRSVLALDESGRRSDRSGGAQPSSMHDQSEIVRRLRSLGLDEADTAELVALALGEAQVKSNESVSRALGRALERLSRDRSIVLALDDAQFLDEASSSVIGQIVDDHPRARILWLIVGRTVERSAAIAPVDEITLGPLSDADVSVLTAALLGARVLPPELVLYLAERAERNPLIVELIVKELSDAALVTVRQGVAEVDLARATVPRTLRALIEGRLARLDTEATASAAGPRDVLRALAILGDRSTLDEVAAFLDVPLDRVRAVLEDPGVAALVSGDRLAPGLADVVLETIPKSEREKGHARAAVLVERSASATGDGLDRVGAHLAASNDPLGAARSFGKAAMLHASGGAQKNVRSDLAARSAVRALAAAKLEDVAVTDVCGWLDVLAESVAKSRARVGFVDLAVSVIERIDSDADVAARVKARLDVARIAAIEGSFEQAEVVLSQARDLATEPELRAETLAREVELRERSGEIERGCDAARALESLGRPIDARVLLDAATLFAARLDIGDATRAIDAAYEIALSDTPLLRASVEVRRARVLLTAGDVLGAQRTSLLAADLAEAHELSFDVGSARLTLAEAYTALNRPERAYAAYVEALEVGEGGGFDRLASLARAGLAYLEGIRAGSSKTAGAAASGSPSSLSRLLQEASARGFVTDAIRMRLFLGKLHLARANTADARAELQKTEQAAHEVGHRALERDAAAALALCG